MIPIKIQCGCGQKYSFDVEPAGGQMPWAVACPVCGTDGTPAANAYIAQSLPAQPAMAASRPAAAPMRLAVAAHQPAMATAGAPAVAPSGGGGLRIAAHTAEATTAAPTPRRPMRLPGQLDHDQAIHEARAKISWGDKPPEVIKFLMMQGFTHPEASSLVKDMFDERASTIRKTGFIRIFAGIGMILVPIVTLIGFLSVGYIPVKIYAIFVMIGLWGAWWLIKGIFMVVAPRFESGDVADK